MLTSEMFLNEMVKTLKSLEGVDDVSISQIPKNNGIYTAVTPKTLGNIFPTFYLEDFYSKYLERKSLDTILEDLVKSFERFKVTGKVDLSITRDFSKIKSKIFPRVLGLSNNYKFFEKLPHIVIEDLSVYFVISYEIQNVGNGTIKVTNDLLRTWGISIETLYDISVENLDKLNNYVVPLDKFLSNKLGLELPREPIPVFVITNEELLYGSSSILHKGLLDSIHENLGDFYIIPSSIHELMVLPKDFDNKEGIINLIKEVNTTIVDPEEVLSDSLYMYDGEFKVA